MPNSKSKSKSQKSKTKTKQKPLKLSGFQAFIVVLPAILLVIFLLFTIWFLVSANKNSSAQMPQTLSNQAYNRGKQYLIDQWKTYTNSTYGFSISYPAVGYIQSMECVTRGNCNNVTLGACGNGIKITPLTNSSNLITIDNMFGIIVNNYYGPIENFITSQGGNLDNFTLTQQKINGAENAVYVSAVKTGNEPTPSSIMTPSYIVKKGNYIYQIAPLQNPGSTVGCLPPAGTNANPFNSKYWNIPASINFE